MTKLIVILGDQLSHNLASLRAADKQHDIILMCELWDEATYVKHHQKKIAFVFSAMRHFANSLSEQGYRVEYIRLDDEGNSGTFTGEVARALKRHTLSQIRITHSGEYRVQQAIEGWQETFSIPVTIDEDDRFCCSISEFKQWAQGRNQLRMEYFYRLMRQKHRILMQEDTPIGGQWNYDSENRKPPKQGLQIPPPFEVSPDAITREVLALVAQRFGAHFGDLEPFTFAVTREQALACLKQFIDQRLANFGSYQDAMLQGEPWMYHSHLSFYLNCGLLLPLECIHKAQEAYERGLVPLNAAEGFIRQILGWREYVRGIYWLTMPDYARRNALGATRALPHFYWSANTKMNCLHQCISETKRNAYAHHIQRLMVLGNFALLAGIHPDEVNEWFLIVYADAYEWVEMPNVSGMILFADGGYLASKPYAAGGNYIHKMSNYCQDCHYDVAQKSGATACPFNYLYWDFIARHQSRFERSPRMSMIYRTYAKMDANKKTAIAQDAAQFLTALEAHEEV